MSKSPSPARSRDAVRRPREQFDINTVIVTGQITKIWGRSGDVYARLRISMRGNLVEPEDEFARFANVRFPQGSVRGEELTLEKGQILRLTAFMVHTSFNETIRRFLEDAGANGFMKHVPKEDMGLWQSITFRRTNAMLNVRRAAVLDSSGKVLETTGSSDDEADNNIDPDNLDLSSTALPVNKVTLEGIVARVWEITRRSAPDDCDRMFRIAVYDRFAPVERGDDGKGGSYGRPRRKPHYINILLPAGQTTTGHKVNVALKDRVRVTGQIGSRTWKVALREALLNTGSGPIAAAMQRLGEETEELDKISTQQEQTHIEAQAVIKYS